ncbi:hypothetical protein JDV02_009651 [Purpureocillium takamizusanense]|uniref:Major facilitator superfamily (MFS) profile domain-containing protein n=1 Tax=Purpureocillium takamizusanense TaxID=2060973 RepID=A0A9Q8QQF2_9HYPO|nr:uncharacterized protein JDV02_009651 [Purpureocillium takamizusanense]UNI23858.1 hypothetical protein JDV02_009651 [Purpureocillium takamizusanense]
MTYRSELSSCEIPLEAAVVAAGGSAGHYEPIPEYEGRHRYDPTASWDPKEEQRLVRKLDYRICSWVCLMFFALQLDRGNIIQALSDNMLTDLGLTTNDYNTGMTIFYVCFLTAELPSQMVSKKLGPDVWIPIQMVSWSAVTCCQAAMRGRSGFFATRGFLGVLEGGFVPDAILYLSYFYKSDELPARVSYFYTSSYLTRIVAALLAYGVLHMRGLGDWAGWRWLFIIEGALTTVVGVISWFYLPPSPTQTASWFRGKDGWFSEREEVIMVNRILRDDPAKGGMHNRQGLTLPLLWQALLDWDLWPIYLLGFTLLQPVQPVETYMTLNLRNLGFDTFLTNLLTIPAYVLFCIQLIFWTWVSERINNRFLVTFFFSVWMFPLILALRLLPDDASNWVRYALTTLIVGYPFVHSILVSLTSRNAGTVRTRTVGSAIINMTGQAGSIISSNIYRKDDAPYYRRGNAVILGIIAWNAVATLLIKFYYVWRNKTRDKIWNAMSPQEKDDYLTTTTDEGSKRLDFRFAH